MPPFPSCLVHALPRPPQMRTPAEAQSFISDRGHTRTPNLPSKTWKHQNSELIKDSINFNIKVCLNLYVCVSTGPVLCVVQYLGSVIIKNLHGNQSAEEACLKLRVSQSLVSEVLQ